MHGKLEGEALEKTGRIGKEERGFFEKKEVWL